MNEGTNKDYELLYIIDPEAKEGEDKVVERALQLLARHGARVTQTESWGKKRLAYPIKKKESGVYEYVAFSAPSESIVPLNRDFRLAEDLLRFMILARPEKLANQLNVSRPKRTAEPAADEPEPVAEIKEEV